MYRLDFAKEIHLYTNASKSDTGCATTQIHLPPNEGTAAVPSIFDSCTFSITERQHPTYLQKEALCPRQVRH